MKMIKIRQTNLLTPFLLATLVLIACSITSLQGNAETVRGSGNVVEESRPVSGVSGVNLATIGDLTIEVGDTESLRIEAEDNLMEYFETEVRNGKLTIGTQSNVRLETTQPVKYYLTVTGLDTIDISSAGNIQTPDLEAEQFSITISSAGNLMMGNLGADTLEVDLSSAGNLDIAGGEIKKQNITITGPGNYNAQDLASAEADVRLASAGSATIWVRDQLKANLSSSGNLRYRGNPTVDATTNSSGKVIQISE
jgi:hypothetical protein